MKVHVDVECTPEEARTLLGLPDVKPMQAALMADIEARMKKNLAAMEPESLLKMWMPTGVPGFEQWQKFLRAAFLRGRDMTETSSDPVEESPKTTKDTKK
jgi:hypothetical protein